MRPLSLFVVVSLLAASASLAGGRTLRGQVMLLGAQDELTPAVGAVVVVTGRGDSDVADSNGQFRVFIDDSYREGETFTLSVNKKGWRIFHPLDGQFSVPASPNKQVLQVQLLPLGSKRFWSDERIEKLLRDEIAAAQHQNALDEGPTQLKAAAKHISDWAARNGFSEQEVREEINRWAAEVEKRQDDQEKQGLAAFARKDFKRASELLTAGANDADVQLAKEVERVAELKAQSVRRHWVAGDANYNSQTYGQALVQYQTALGLVDRDAACQQWTELMLRLGETQLAISKHSQPKWDNENERAAKAIFRQLVRGSTRAQSPVLWAHAQLHLAEVLLNEEASMSKEADGSVLVEAVTACRAALEFHTRELFPVEWGRLQNYLINALVFQSKTVSRAEAKQLLAEAATLAEQSLQVFTQTAPRSYSWRMAQMNLSNVLLGQSEHLPHEQISSELARAEVANRAALDGWSRDQSPSEWALGQHNLGVLLMEQAEAEPAGAARACAEAAKSFRLALEVHTRQHEPFIWSADVSALADSLMCQSRASPSEDSLRLQEEAVRAYRMALEVRTPARLPQAWARTQLELVSALSHRAVQLSRAGRRAEGFQDSVEAVALCQEVVAQTRQRSPRTWAHAQDLLARALLIQMGNTSLYQNSNLKREALEAARAADGFIDDDGRPPRTTALVLDFIKQLDGMLQQQGSERDALPPRP